MQFMNAEVQTLFFEIHRERRKKRDIALVEASDEHREKLDKCLDLIVCHHPDVWSRGTGLLLIAPKNRGYVESQKRALCWRSESHSEHNYMRYYTPHEDEHIGFFIRKTMEYYDRVRCFLCESEFEDNTLSPETHEIIEYVENNILQEFQNYFLESEISRRRGIRTYGIEFDYHRSITKNCYDQQILDQIEEYARSDLVCDPLRNVLLDNFPDILDNEHVPRQLSFEDYETDVYTDPDFPDHLPELIKSTGECIVCYTEGDVLEWPCHSSHVMCENCTNKIFVQNPLCPFCRKHIWLD